MSLIVDANGSDQFISVAGPEFPSLESVSNVYLPAMVLAEPCRLAGSAPVVRHIDRFLRLDNVLAIVFFLPIPRSTVFFYAQQKALGKRHAEHCLFVSGDV